MLETILLTALYDPKEDIVVSGLLGLRRAGSVTRALVPAVGNRLLELMRRSGRYVRIEVLGAAASLYTTPEFIGNLESLLSEARADRSWLVRDAVTRVEQTDISDFT